MIFLPVIGLEIHLQVNTKTKMFCRCSNQYFASEPNSHTCEVCFGLPGALPMPNKEALNKAVMLALALNCKINDLTKFDRKNYYYPDLPKGYQISQLDKPIGYDGYVEIETGDDSKRIRIQRMHLEEDTAKSIHGSEETLIDFNKSGVPLIEVVTEPDFQSVDEVTAFAKRLRQIVRYTNVGDAEMQKGQMRFELNISVKKQGLVGLPGYKVEIKNIGSISVLEKVIKFEIARQTKAQQEGIILKNETRGIIGMTGQTKFQRSKENSDDYRYFPEPDIAPITISNELIESIRAAMVELPISRKQRYVAMGLHPMQAEVFIEDKERGDFLDAIVSLASKKSPLSKEKFKTIATLVGTEIAGILAANSQSFAETSISPETILIVIDSVESKNITVQMAKEILAKNLFAKPKEIKKQIQNCEPENNIDLSSIVKKTIESNSKVVSDINKNPNAKKFLLGQVMRETKGRFSPQIIEIEIDKQLKKSG